MIGVFLTYFVPHWTCSNLGLLLSLFISIHFCQCEHEETRGTKKERFGAGEIAKWLRVLAASVADSSLILEPLLGGSWPLVTPAPGGLISPSEL